MNRRTFLQATSAAIGTSILAGCNSANLLSCKDKSPNFVVIFLDDLGYGDIGCFGHPTIKTPNLDKMAKNGVKLTQFYSASSICSPSRAALLTGRLPIRTTVNAVFWPNQTTGLPENEITIASALKQKDYTTKCIGKWHLGHTKPHLPSAHGFDSYFGIPFSNDMCVDPKMDVDDNAVFREGMTIEKMRSEKPKWKSVPLLKDDKIIEYPCEQTTLTKRYAENAVEFIRENKSKPFFLYLAQTMPHIPLFASDEFDGKSKRGLYGDTVEEIDNAIGQILTELEKQKLTDNTMVIFTSDNGPWLNKGLEGGSEGPFKGGKFTCWEGGFREPCIISWPGTIPAGETKMEMASTLDVFPTILSLAGLPIPTDRVIDGYDLTGYLTGNEKSPRNTMFYYFGKRIRAVRWQQWKLHVEIAVDELSSKYKTPEKPLLFDVEQDPRERFDIADEHQEIVEKILEMIEIHSNKI